jgi:hypothetical protein
MNCVAVLVRCRQDALAGNFKGTIGRLAAGGKQITTVRWPPLVFSMSYVPPAKLCFGAHASFTTARVLFARLLGIGLLLWSNGMTLDFESTSRGSIPRKSSSFFDEGFNNNRKPENFP